MKEVGGRRVQGEGGRGLCPGISLLPPTSRSGQQGDRCSVASAGGLGRTRDMQQRPSGWNPVLQL